MATHSSTLAWRIPWTEETDGLKSTGLQRVGHEATEHTANKYVFLNILLTPRSGSSLSLALFIFC